MANLTIKSKTTMSQNNSAVMLNKKLNLTVEVSAINIMTQIRDLISQNRVRIKILTIMDIVRKFHRAK
jgi:hypothetical protein